MKQSTDEHDGEGRRTTTAHHRYEIGDSECGVIDTATSLRRATALATGHAERHAAEPHNTVTRIMIYDRMARRDCQREWEIGVAAAEGRGR